MGLRHLTNKICFSSSWCANKSYPTDSTIRVHFDPAKYFLSVSVSLCLHVNASMCPCVYLSMFPICLMMCLFVYVFMCLRVHVFMCPCFHVSMCPCVYLFMSPCVISPCVPVCLTWCGLLCRAPPAFPWGTCAPCVAPVWRLAAEVATPPVPCLSEQPCPRDRQPPC